LEYLEVPLVFYFPHVFPSCYLHSPSEQSTTNEIQKFAVAQDWLSSFVRLCFALALYDFAFLRLCTTLLFLGSVRLCFALALYDFAFALYGFALLFFCC